MATDSTLAMLRTIKAQLLAYQPPGGAPTLLDRLGTAPGAGANGRLYINQPPDNLDPKQPWGLMRLQLANQEGDDGHYLQRAEIELQFCGAQRSASEAVKAMADVAHAALRHWVDLTGGMVRSQGGLTRSTVFYDAPEVREKVVERILQPIRFLPTYLTDTA